MCSAVKLRTAPAVAGYVQQVLYRVGVPQYARVGSTKYYSLGIIIRSAESAIFNMHGLLAMLQTSKEWRGNAAGKVIDRKH